MKLFCLFIFSLFSLSLFSQEDYQFEKAELKEVKLYRNNAELFSEGTISLKPGIHDYYITGLTSTINESTIIFACDNTQLYSLEYVKNLDYLDKSSIKSLLDSMDILTKKVELLRVNTRTIDAQLEYYNSINKVIPTDKFKYTVQEFQQYQSLISNQLNDLLNNRIKNEDKIKESENKLSEIRTKIDRLRAESRTDAIKVSIKSTTNQKSKFYLNYISTDAGWQISYDLSIDKIGNKAILASKANIYQKTGMDWNDVKLIINDAVQLNMNIPTVYPWIFSEREYKSSSYSSGLDAPLAPKKESSSSIFAKSKKSLMQSGNVETEVNENFTSESYVIPDRLSISNNTRKKVLKFNTKEIDVDLYFYCAPKYNENVFLVAKIKNHLTLNLKEAEVTTYLEEVYRGKTNLEIEDNEVPEISFGVIDDVKVVRKRITEYTEGKFLSSDKERKYKYNMKITNNKKIKINFKMKEHIPLIKSDSFDLEIIDISGAKKDEENILTWDFDMEPGESIEKNLEYILTYPEGFYIRD